MRLTLSALMAGVFATPALAASGPFFSLGNTDFVVLLAFLLFIAVLFYFNVPSLLGGMLDSRADGICRQSTQSLMQNAVSLDERKTLRTSSVQFMLAAGHGKNHIRLPLQCQSDRIVGGGVTGMQ